MDNDDEGGGGGRGKGRWGRGLMIGQHPEANRYNREAEDAGENKKRVEPVGGEDETNIQGRVRGVVGGRGCTRSGFDPAVSRGN